MALRFVTILWLWTVCDGSFAKDTHIEIYSRRVQESETIIEQDDFFAIHSSNFEWYFHSPQREQYVTVSKTDAAKMAAQMSYQSREFAEKVYQSRKVILEKIGNVLPGLRFDLNDVTSLPGAMSNMVGFLVPSNWFNLAAAKKFYKSERYALLDFLIDQHFETENIYLNIHMMIKNYFIRKHFQHKTNAFISQLEKDFNSKNHEMNDGERFKFQDGIDQLRIFSGSFFSQVFLIEKQIVEILENFAFLLSFDLDLRVRIESLKVPHVGDKDKIDVDDFKGEILAKSYLLKSLKQLEKSAIQNRRAGVFSFLSVAQNHKYSLGVNFGLSNVAQVQISTSQIEEVRIARKEAENRISRAIHNLISDQNIAVDLAEELYSYKHDYEALLAKHLRSYKETGLLDAQSFRRGVKWGVTIEERLNLASHIYMISQAELSKFRIGRAYRYIEGLIPVIREQLKDDKKERKKKRKQEKDKVEPYVLGK